VLDVGCGNRLSRHAHGRTRPTRPSGRSVRRDARRSTEQNRRHRVAVTFQLGDAEAPPPDGAPYDTILERHVLWTCPNPGRRSRLAGVAQTRCLLILSKGFFEMGPIARSIHSLRPSCPYTVTARRGARQFACGGGLRCRRPSGPLMDAALCSKRDASTLHGHGQTAAGMKQRLSLDLDGKLGITARTVLLA